MSQSMIWAILLAATVGTFLFRYSFLWLSDRYPMPERMRQLLKYIPASVIAALTLPAILTPAIHDGNWHAPRFLAGVIAMLVMWRTRSALLTLVLGMVALWLGRWLAL